MEKIPFLIITIFCLRLTIKYFFELKNERLLQSTLMFMGASFLLVAANFIFLYPVLPLIGLLSFMFSLVLFLIHLIKQKFTKEKSFYLGVMATTTVLVFLRFLFQFNHYPGAVLLNFILIIPLILGLIITFKKYQIKESKPFNLVIVMMVIDFVRFVHRFL